MSTRAEKRWVAAAVALWAMLLIAAIALAVFVHRRSTAILEYVALTDPAPRHQALVKRLEANRLVTQALALCKEATTDTATAPATTSGPVVAEAVPLLDKAERLYLESLDLETSQPTLLFHLAEVNFLLGRSARAYQFLARYWEAIGQENVAQVYRRRATGE